MEIEERLKKIEEKLEKIEDTLNTLYGLFAVINEKIIDNL